MRAGVDEGISASIKSVFQGGKTVDFFWNFVLTSIISFLAFVALLFAWNQVSDIDLYTERKLPVRLDVQFCLKHISSHDDLWTAQSDAISRTSNCN